jgi:hypothetical protein
MLLKMRLRWMDCKSLLDRACTQVADQRNTADTSLQDIRSNRNVDRFVFDATQDYNRFAHNSSGQQHIVARPRPGAAQRERVERDT